MGAYADLARGHGVLSTLSLPLFIDERAIGALNLYSSEQVDAFGDDVRQRALEFAERASVALTLAIRFDAQAKTAYQLEQALDVAEDLFTRVSGRAPAPSHPFEHQPPG